MNTMRVNLADLVVPDAQPRLTGAHEKAVDAHRVDQRHQGGIPKPPDLAALQVINFETPQFRQVDKFVRGDSILHNVLAGNELARIAQSQYPAGPRARATLSS